MILRKILFEGNIIFVKCSPGYPFCSALILSRLVWPFSARSALLRTCLACSARSAGARILLEPGGSGAVAGNRGVGPVGGSGAGMMDGVRVVVMIPGVRVVVVAALETGSAAAVKIASSFNAVTGTAGDVAGWTSPAREEAKAAATAAAVDTVGECVNE